MAGFRVFVLSLCVVCLGVGLVNSQETIGEASGEPPPENSVVFDGVEVCGPIYEAFLFIGPKDESGKLDSSRIEPFPHPSGLFRAEFPPAEDVTIEFAGFTATSVQLGDFKGNTQTVIAIWDLGIEEGKAVWAGMNAELREAHGEPVDENDVDVTWEAGRLRTTINLNAETGTADLWYHCAPTEDEFWARVDSVEVPEDPADVSKAGNEFPALSRTLGQSLLSVLVENGEPTAEPYWQEPGVLGLYFEKVNSRGVPENIWFWFVDGETVYKGLEFPSPFGESEAPDSFRVFSETFNKFFGEPFASIGGEEFDRIQNRWLNGGEEILLRLESADDPPWFRMEMIDFHKIKKIKGDLRPGRKPVPRYVPPPRDSGKTRHELMTGSARG